MIDTDIERLTTNVTNLQKDMAQVGILVDRLDVTIEKLTEVSTTVSQLLAVQGNRLEFQEKVAEKLQELVEKRRQEFDSNIKDLYIRIEKVEKDLQKDLDENNAGIIKEIKDLRATGEKQHTEINERMGRFEKWMYSLVGGGAIILWILNNIDSLQFLQ